MKFKSIAIKNFRNFSSINVNLSNRNVFFGLNDVGKTNFLYALRFVFDYSIRKNGFKLSDFYNSDDSNEIKITVEIDISDLDDQDSQKVIAKAGKSLSSNYKSVFIIAKSEKNEGNYDIILSWGDSCETADIIPQNSNRSDLDKLFEITYFDSNTDLDKLFKLAISSKKLLKRGEDDKTQLLDKVAEVNTEIEKLSSVNSFQETILSEIEKFDKNIKIKITSNDITIDPYKTLYPYIEKDNNSYYVSGDGMRKVMSYTLNKLLAQQTSTTKISLFLVEEPENHLHKSMLLKFSRILFDQKEMPYLFLTTHSSNLLTEMHDVNLIRIVSDKDVYSCLYNVPEEYEKLKRILNASLSEALFYNKVLLVEGPSEVALFDSLLTYKCQYKEKDMVILPVNGIAFEKYLSVLVSLNIQVFIKTDNDIDKNNRTLGLNRVKNLSKLMCKLKKDDNKYNEISQIEIIQDSKSDIRVNSTQLYSNNENLVNLCNSIGVFLSKKDLENDLAEALGGRLGELLNQDTIKKAVDFLQKKKLYNMVDLVEKLEDLDLKKIYEHNNFKVLRSFCGDVI